MKQVSRVLLNYSVDLFGICSSLYELGGLIVMHDASGCNSTYATHDEPRWYDKDSLIYISALTEYDAVLGNDDKYISDVCEIAEEKHPRFIAVFGSPVAIMTGTDFRGIARVVESRTGIPTFGFETTGMQTYVRGMSDAFAAVARRLLPDAGASPGAGSRRSGAEPIRDSSEVPVNLLGVTPLDFSVVGNVEALRAWMKGQGFPVVSCWAMGDSFDTLCRSEEAAVNVVCSAGGLACAKVLQKKYGTPYVIGLPVGSASSEKLARRIRAAAEGSEGPGAGSNGPDRTGTRTRPDDPSGTEEGAGLNDLNPAGGTPEEDTGTLLIGEPVFCEALRETLEHLPEFDAGPVRIVCPVEETAGVLRPGDVCTREEEDIRFLMEQARRVIADPAYARALPEAERTKLIPLPHEAYSGRHYRAGIPVFIGPAFDVWLGKQFGRQNRISAAGR